jgi:hypothetical protein
VPDRPPAFLGDGLPELMYAHLNCAAPAVSSLVPGLPRGLDDVVRRGLAKDPDRRWATAGELAAAARTVLAGRPRPEVVVPHAPPTAIQPRPAVEGTVGFSHAGPPAGGQPPTTPMVQRRPPAPRVPAPRGVRIDFSAPPPRLPTAPPHGPEPQVSAGARPVGTTTPPEPHPSGPLPVPQAPRARPAWAERQPAPSRLPVVLLAVLLVVAGIALALYLALAG